MAMTRIYEREVTEAATVRVPSSVMTHIGQVAKLTGVTRAHLLRQLLMYGYASKLGAKGL